MEEQLLDFKFKGEYYDIILTGLEVNRTTDTILDVHDRGMCEVEDVEVSDFQITGIFKYEDERAIPVFLDKNELSQLYNEIATYFYENYKY